MISKICLNSVASYKSTTFLETDKKVNLIYGLNGSGKSTLSNYLYKPTENIYKDCYIEGLDNDKEVLVYNQNFIQENFFNIESLKGIFTLSKVNKDAETIIAKAQKEIDKLENEKKKKNSELEAEKLSINKKQDFAKNNIWQIKTDYSGGDRVLEFCLDGYKGSKDSLFNYIIDIQKPNEKPTTSINDLKNDLQLISGDNAQKYPELFQIEFTKQNIEQESLFSKQIVGNENSSISSLIKSLNNPDWVKTGLQYLPIEPIQENVTCPFCQEKTISNTLIENIKNYFDASYEADVNSIKSFLVDYSQATQSIVNESFFEANPITEIYKKDFYIKYNTLINIIDNNKKLIDLKIKMPSVPITLENSAIALQELNDIIKKTNILIIEHNNNIDKKEILKSKIKKIFWENMRWHYDQTISSFKAEKIISIKNVESLEKEIKNLETKIGDQNVIITEQQKLTINIDEAIANINRNLMDLGIDDFKIIKYSENLYKIVRDENNDKVFRSLSEGEKMIISFLYFIELCKGKQNVTKTGEKKIVVIDDPISSLSHIYIFNVGRLIHNEFLRSDKYEQIFLLTHSLYFFYEMTDTNHERRKAQQKLFRIKKNATGSIIHEMSYEEIQNDYHSYWCIIKDDQQKPALIANCMRNIIEYFFNFVEKQDLNNIFQKPAMQEVRFQAFNRYINRESHSLGQNIFDIKEFNYNDFKDAFELVFKENGYEKHYKKMLA